MSELLSVTVNEYVPGSVPGVVVLVTELYDTWSVAAPCSLKSKLELSRPVIALPYFSEHHGVGVGLALLHPVPGRGQAAESRPEGPAARPTA